MTRFRLLPTAWRGPSHLALWAAVLLSPVMACGATRYPLTVRSCDRDIVIEAAPRRAVAHDVNMIEMMLALGLAPRMAGYTGIGDSKQRPAGLGKLPELSRQYPSLETLLAARTDFFFAGWNYGMHVGGPVTPESLARFHIPVYVLSESCAHVMPTGPARFEDVYRDLHALGDIFDVASAAQQRVAAMRSMLATVTRALAAEPSRPSVFVYDSGTDKPFTAGALAMPSAIIAAAGGRNVLDDVPRSWTRVGWETLRSRDPDIILIVDYGSVSAADKVAFLSSMSGLRELRAIRERRFVILPYAALTPGIHNAEAALALAHALHPQATRALPHPFAQRATPDAPRQR